MPSIREGITGVDVGLPADLITPAEGEVGGAGDHRRVVGAVLQPGNGNGDVIPANVAYLGADGSSEHLVGGDAARQDDSPDAEPGGGPGRLDRERLDHRLLKRSRQIFNRRAGTELGRPM